MNRITLGALALALSACTVAPAASNTTDTSVPSVAVAPPPLVSVEVVARFPHDVRAFTEGLLVDDGVMFESIGLEGRSDVRRVDIATGQTLTRSPIDRTQFGEGLARWGDQLISLTWTDGIAHRWQLPGLTDAGAFRYTGEGWGLTASDSQLIQSDGSATISFRNPLTFAVERTIIVRAGGREVRRLNELEYIDGRIWANIWMTPYIAVIDPADGRVTHLLDLRPLVAEINTGDGDAVLNGIAYDRATRRLYVTGKYWPTLFELRLPVLN